MKKKNFKQFLKNYIFHIITFIIIILFKYPTLYGVDSFEIIWMSNVFYKYGLYFQNTWLFNLLSYLGYYPFSHRPVGLPLIIALLMKITNFITLGEFGLTEVILIYNFFLFILVLFETDNLGKLIFPDEIKKKIFVTSIIFSPNILTDCLMTLSTRIIITILMIEVIRLTIVISREEEKKNFLVYIFKIFFYIVLGSFFHRLSLFLILPLIMLLFSKFVLSFSRIENLTFKKILSTILIILFILFPFIGFKILYLDPKKIESPFFSNASFYGLVFNLIIHYFLDFGLILIFFPVGFCKLLKNTIYPLFKYKEELFIQEKWFLVFFLYFFFISVPSFYSTTLFLPLIIIISLDGLDGILNRKNKRKNLIYLKIAIFSLILSLFYMFAYSFLIITIPYLSIVIILGIILIFFAFLFIYYFQTKRPILKITAKITKFINYSEILALIFLFLSILIFSITTIDGRIISDKNKDNIWEKQWLTNEENELINFLSEQEIDGFIFTNFEIIAKRISSITLLPVISKRDSIGTAVYYGLITKNEIEENLIFSVYRIDQGFFIYNKTDPLDQLNFQVNRLNLSNPVDLEKLKDNYKIQFIITPTQENCLNDDSNLYKSLFNSFSPVFSTKTLLVWKMY